ncbi:NERD domain-containing protein [Streptomyces sp. NPDC005955]|uniref:nuclease-related domain-containing protein n=1 Tax=Streptomyces sp. NPDC005955 TaxID=3364738 RepID=UPI0036A25727
MVALRVSEWKRHGQDRLYVNSPDGKAVAWFDRRTGHIEVVDESLRQPILDALTPYVTRTAGVSDAVEPTRRTPPPEEYDLALRGPGDALKDKIREVSPTLPGRILTWLLRRRTEDASWRAGLRGERLVSRELARLERHGWRTLHSVPLSSTWDIDHLLIGPGGVFSINTKNHRNKSVWVGDHATRINYGKGRPYPRSSRREAAIVKRVLDRGCGFSVPVNPVLVFVRPAKLTVEPTLQDVRAIEDRELSALRPLAGALSPEQADAVYAVARDQRSWAAASRGNLLRSDR